MNTQLNGFDWLTAITRVVKLAAIVTLVLCLIRALQ